MTTIAIMVAVCGTSPGLLRVRFQGWRWTRQRLAESSGLAASGTYRGVIHIP